MKPIPIVLAVAVASIASVAIARDYKLGPLEIEHPWSRATPKGAMVAGAYLTIKNTGGTADRLTGGTVAIADRVEVHEMTMDQGVMRMRMLKNGLELKPGEATELKPGSYHLMFITLKEPLEQGKTVKGTLTFEKAGSVEVEFTVEAMGAQSPSHGGHGKM